MKKFLLLAAWAWACGSAAQPLHILVTGDMHGWLGNAPATLAAWKREEGYKLEDFLVLSAGDIATGPAVSTVYKGVPAVEVMNAMGYDATALGNHEFDFGLDQLSALEKMASFPFLSANVLAASGSEATLVPAYAVIQKVGIKIGIIGLTTSDLGSIAVTGAVSASNYASTLRAWAPKVRAKGAQLLLVLAHVPLDELEATAAEVVDLGIPLMMGGHSHELGQAREPKSGTWIVNSGEWWRAYSRIDLDVDPASGRTTVLACKQVWVDRKDSAADPALKALVHTWQAKLDADPVYSNPLGTLASPLTRFWGVNNFVCDAWLAMDPQSEIALNNDGALRQDLEAGPITKASLTGLMPFNDSLLRLNLSGKDLLEYLPREGGGLMGMAGLSRKDGTYVLAKTGRPLDRKKRYAVLFNNYMVDTSAQLKKADPHPQTADADWKAPVLRWLALHPSSPELPLDRLLDLKPRL